MKGIINILQLGLIIPLLAFIPSQAPLATFRKQVGPLRRIALRNIWDSLLGIPFFNQVVNKCFVPNRASLRFREAFQAFKVSGFSECI